MAGCVIFLWQACGGIPAGWRHTLAVATACFVLPCRALQMSTLLAGVSSAVVGLGIFMQREYTNIKATLTQEGQHVQAAFEVRPCA